MLGRLHLDEAAPIASTQIPSPADPAIVRAKPALLPFSGHGQGGPAALGSSPPSRTAALKSSCPEEAGGDGRPAQFVCRWQETAGQSLGLLSSDGRFKRLPNRNISGASSAPRRQVLQAQDGIELCPGGPSARRGKDLLVASSTGRCCALWSNDRHRAAEWAKTAPRGLC